MKMGVEISDMDFLIESTFYNYLWNIQKENDVD